jgi:hypothetical protein
MQHASRSTVQGLIPGLIAVTVVASSNLVGEGSLRTSVVYDREWLAAK